MLKVSNSCFYLFYGSTQTTTFFLSDGLGSVLGVFSSTANSASLLASQLYAPYGSSHYGSGSVSPYTNKGFTGQYNDPTSGLDYYGARYYDPVVGLFVSKVWDACVVSNITSTESPLFP